MKTIELNSYELNSLTTEGQQHLEMLVAIDKKSVNFTKIWPFF